jgi:acyl carrier protein
MSVKEKLNEVFRDVFDEDFKEGIRPEMTAADVNGWDSLTHIQLIMAIESKFNLTFTVEDILDLKNVGEMIELIERKTSVECA